MIATGSPFFVLLRKSHVHPATRTKPGHRKIAMDSTSLRLEVLRLLQEHALTGSPVYVADEDVVATTGEPHVAVQQAFDQLEEQGFTETANSHAGRRARISPKGTLELERLGPSTERQASGAQPDLVFISHAQADLRLAKRLGEEIEHRLPGTKTFISSRKGDIRPKDEWFEKIKDNLRTADAYITIVTPSSKDRPWVLWEHGVAWMRQRTSITARVGISNAEIPEPFRILQIHALDDVEAAAEVFRDLGDDGEGLDSFCKDVAAIASATPRPDQAPGPIQVRWAGGKLSGWDSVSRNLEIHLRAGGPVKISEIEAVMWHRDDPEMVYPALPRPGWKPEILGRGQESITQALRFRTSRIPGALRREQPTATNMIRLQAKVAYVDSAGLSGTEPSGVLEV